MRKFNRDKYLIIGSLFLLSTACSLTQPLKVTMQAAGGKSSALEKGYGMLNYKLSSLTPQQMPDPNAPVKGHISVAPNSLGRYARRRLGRNAPVPATHAQTGTYIPYTYSSMDTGVYAGQSAYLSTELTIPATGSTDDLWLYTPTLYGADNCQFEVVTVYHRYKSNGAEERYIGLWDHSYPNPDGTHGAFVPGTSVPIDSTFRSQYMRSFIDSDNGGDNHDQGYLYFAKIQRTSGVWRAYLFNFSANNNQGAWYYWNVTPVGTQTAPRTGGWSMFETDGLSQATGGPCVTLPTVRSTRIQQMKYNSSTSSYFWDLTSGIAMTTGTTECSSNLLHWDHQYYEWDVHR